MIQLKQEIVYFFRKMYEQKTINMFEGNISVRVGDVVYMTPSQMNKEKITPEMIVEMDLQGNVLSNTVTLPSSEAKMHLEVYRLREDLKAVVHAHSAYASAYAMNNMPIRNEMAELYLFYGGEVPVCRYAEPGTKEIYADFEKYFVEEDKDVVLLANHGIVAAAKDVETAYSRIEAVEKLAQIGTIAKSIGEPSYLTEEEKNVLLKRYANRVK